jgi:hypothetical protein
MLRVVADRLIHASLAVLVLLLIPLTAQAHRDSDKDSDKDSDQDPVSVLVSPVPAGLGTSFSPGVRLVADLPEEYVEEEFLVSGAATLFNYAHNPPLGPTDLVAIQENVPYTTRIIVRRPVKRSRFKGTVVIEWWNSTAGFDSAPVWDTSAEYFAREGVTYVGVTNSTTAIDFLTGGCRLFGVLPPSCSGRYATLLLPENGVAFEMMSQIANLLKSSSSENPLPERFEVDRLYHAGQSQQGGSVVTYASAFHFRANDGYFVQQAATARPINFGPACGASGSPAFPACTPRLQGGDVLVRTDLPVPVVHAISETDIEVLFGIIGRQPDTPTFRYYEIAGAGHLTVHKDVEVVPAGLFGPFPLLLEDLCQNAINSTADGPVFLSYVLNALWENLEDQVQRGHDPPDGIVMEVDGSGAIVRDEFGNGLGGVRLPSVEVPIATYTPGNLGNASLPPFIQGIGNLACFLASSVTPFDQATLDELYPSQKRYVREVRRSARDLRRQGFLLREDRRKIRSTAEMTAIGLP